MATLHSLGASALLALTVGSLPLLGAVYQGSANEGFDYAPGTVDGTYGGGTGWNASGDASANTTTWAVGANLVATGSRAVTADSLSNGNPAYPASIGNAVLISGAGQVGRSFGQTIDAGSFYFSYLTRKTVDTLRTVNLSFFSATNERLAIGQIANNVNTRDQDGVWQAGAGANDGNFALFLANSQNNPSGQAVESAFNGVYVNTTAPISYAVDRRHHLSRGR